MTKKSELLTLLIETATVALKTKAKMVKRSRQRNTSRKIFERHAQQIEDAMATAIAPLIEEQVASMKEGLLELGGSAKSTITSDQAQALAAQVFDPNDQKWKDSLLDKALPVMVEPMLKAMKAGMVEAGINPTKGLKSNA